MNPREQLLRQLKETQTNIGNQTDFKPDIGIVLGSGFAQVADIVKVKTSIPYYDIVHFPLSTIEGHPGNLIFGEAEGKKLAILQGRFHFYEGYTMWGITFPIRVLAMLGVKTLIIAAACGGINDIFTQGDIVMIKDHLNLMSSNPLIGPHVNEMGERFVDMNEPYDTQLQAILSKAADSAGIDVKKGVYAAVNGPNYETPAEVKMLNKLGADMVGMSVVPEVITAKQMGLKVCGLTVISNDNKAKKPTTHEKVLENVSKTRAKFVKLLQVFLRDLS